MRRAAAGFDEFGNPKGRAYDLGGGDENRIRGERILIYPPRIHDCVCAEADLHRVMIERGLHLDMRYAPIGRTPPRT